MPEETSPLRQQTHEGPWRKLTPERINCANEVHEPLPGGRTGEEIFDELYGEGNWNFDESRFSAERTFELEVVRAENRIAMEGLRNVITDNAVREAEGKPFRSYVDTYVDNDGSRLTGRVYNRAARPAKGDILISPDGDKHFIEKQGK